MSNVKLSIGGRDFTVACAPGEEGHIAELGATIDAKLRAMGGATGNSESRMLLFAALLLADELHDSRSGADNAAAQRGLEAETRLAKLPAAINAIAERAERIAASLEKASANA